MLKLFLTLLISLSFSTGFSQSAKSIDVIVNLKKEKSDNQFGFLEIIIKTHGKVEKVDTLNVVDEFKKAEILRFKKARLQVNVDYGDRKAGFTKVINKRGRLRFELWYNSRKTSRNADLYFLKNKSKYEELVHLSLTGPHGIGLRDAKKNKKSSVISSCCLFDLMDINQYKREYSPNNLWLSIDSDTLTSIWYVDPKEKNFIEKRKNYINKVILENDNGYRIKLEDDLEFYLEKSATFNIKHINEIHIHNKDDVFTFE